MWIDAEAEVRSRMQDRAREAARRRLLAQAGASRAGTRRPAAGYAWRLRQAAGPRSTGAPPWGSRGPLRRLVRTGLRLLDAGRA